MNTSESTEQNKPYLQILLEENKTISSELEIIHSESKAESNKMTNRKYHFFTVGLVILFGLLTVMGSFNAGEMPIASQNLFNRMDL